MQKLVNLTPHPVILVGNDGRVVDIIPKSENPLRLPEITAPLGEINGVPIIRKTLDPAASFALLPPFEQETYYIVSLPVALVIRRPDFLVPDDLVRDEKDRVIGCRRFAVVV
uniref:Uncharacterized protein n=1 Tax=Ammonifex degensii TaxID=42838 RepID=A0A7C2E291_9THEO